MDDYQSVRAPAGACRDDHSATRKASSVLAAVRALLVETSAGEGYRDPAEGAPRRGSGTGVYGNLIGEADPAGSRRRCRHLLQAAQFSRAHLQVRRARQQSTDVLFL